MVNDYRKEQQHREIKEKALSNGMKLKATGPKESANRPVLEEN